MATFQTIDTYGPGKVTLRLPGTDLHWEYAGGDAQRDAPGTVAIADLVVTDCIAVASPSTSGGLFQTLLAGLGAQLREQLQDPAIRSRFTYVITQQPHLGLCLSRDAQGRALVTLPGLGGEGVSEIAEDFLVNAYAMGTKCIPEVASVYDAHVTAFKNQILPSRRLKSDARDLPQIVNRAYELVLEKMG